MAICVPGPGRKTHEGGATGAGRTGLHIQYLSEAGTKRRFVRPIRTGARYSPSTDSWIPTGAGDGVPYARYSHSAVWTGHEMILWGGLTPYYPDQTEELRSDGARYCAAP